LAEPQNHRFAQGLARWLTGRLLILAALSLHSLTTFADNLSSFGMLNEEQLTAEHASATNDPHKQAELALWMAYKVRYDQDRSLVWHNNSVAALERNGPHHPDLANVSDLLACNLRQHDGLMPESACLELRQNVASMATPDLRAISWHLLGNLYMRSGLLMQALEINQLALAEAEQAGLTSALSAIHNSRGVAYLELGLPLKAFEHFQLAHQYLEQSHNPIMRRILAFNLGASQLRAKLFDEAKQTFLAALPWVEENGSTPWMVTALTFLARAEIGLGNPEAAINSLQPHLQAHGQDIDNNTLLNAEAALAEALLATGQIEPALTKLTTALQQAKANNNSARIEQLQLILAGAYNLAENPSAALAIISELRTTLDEARPTESLFQAFRISAASNASLGNYATAFTEQARAQQAERMTQSSNFKTQLSLLQAKLDRDKNAHELMLSQQRERELFIQSRLSQTVLIGSLLLGGLLVLIVYLLLSRLFQKRLAERERYASARLEAQVVDRTQALESTMAARLNVEEDRRLLQQSLFEGEKLRALGQLTGGVAHDFNNLMTVVTLSAELLKDDLTQEQTRAQQSVTDILRAAESAADITSGLLAYARQQPLTPELVELQTFTSELLPLFQRSLDENIRLQLNAPQSCHVVVDRSQLTTCLLNLLLNAKEALSEGGAIVITLEPAPPEHGEFVRISVTDNGCGMRSNQLKLATEPFFTTKETNQGSGLGLSMVFGFVKQSGGDLNITSTENLGTEVTISLPTAAPSSQPNVDILVSEPVAIPAHAKVLVVEDQQEVRDVLQRLLESLGLELSISVTGDAGKQVLIDQGEPDLLITDIVMPGDTSGYALAAFAQERYPNLAILIISGYSESHDSEWPFLHKPFSLNELRDKVTALLAPQIQPATTLAPQPRTSQGGV
jgi:signal transduction histidine kinase